jgi:CBS domain containing-hemolysin-like protein
MAEQTEGFPGFRLLLIAAILSINAFFAASEVALLSVRDSRLRQMAEDGVAGAKVALQLLARPEKLLSMTQVGVTLASLALGWAGEDTLYTVVAGAFGPIFQLPLAPLVSQSLHALCFLLAFLLMTWCHVVMGEVLPKNLAINKSDRLAVVVAPALMVFTRLAEPFVNFIEGSASSISRGLGLRKKSRTGGHSADELRYIVSSSRGAGHLPETQEDMIHRILDLDELSVREIMVPRNRIVAISCKASLDDVLRTMREQQHSRLPVYQDKPEQIVGILYFKDMVHLWQERRAALRLGRAPRPFDMRQLMRKFLVVPETKPLIQMLDQFREGKSHMALVVDEFGTISGLLTVEDVLEQIVGEIEDEFDEAPSEKAADADTGSENISIEGSTRIRDFETEFEIELPIDAGFETVAGFLLYRLGHIPSKGESVEYEGRRFTVEEMEWNRITKIRVEKLPADIIKR